MAVTVTRSVEKCIRQRGHARYLTLYNVGLHFFLFDGSQEGQLVAGPQNKNGRSLIATGRLFIFINESHYSLICHRDTRLDT